jgi:hypothetical protein
MVLTKVFLFHFNVVTCNVVYTHLLFQGKRFNFDNISIGVMVIGFWNVDVQECCNM